MSYDFQPLTAFLDSAEERFGVPACECIVRQNGREIYRHWAGTMEWQGEHRRPLAGGEWYRIYSCTKLMTMTAALRLWEEKKLDLDDPVSWYLPEYAQMTVREEDGTFRPAKTVLTLRHLMTMTGGFNYDRECPAIQRIKAETGGQANTRQIIRSLATEPLDFDPGTRYQYSLCHDVMGAVIEEISGERFSDYIQNHIAAPLGITGITFHPGQRELSRMPEQLCWDLEREQMFPATWGNDHCLTPNYDSGGAGICARAEDYSPFLDALACGGVGANGYRLLRRETIDLLATNQLEGQPLRDYHANVKPSELEGYGLGLRVRVGDDGVIPVGEFGWDGAAAACTSICRERGLSVIYLEHVLNHMPSYACLHPQLLGLIYRITG